MIDLVPAGTNCGWACLFVGARACDLRILLQRSGYCVLLPAVSLHYLLQKSCDAKLTLGLSRPQFESTGSWAP